MVEVHVYSALDWDTEKGRDYMRSLELIAKESTSRRHEFPTWYDIPPVLAFFQPLLKVPKLFLCAKDVTQVHACKERLTRQAGLSLGPGVSNDAPLLQGFGRFLEEIIKRGDSSDWFSTVRSLEQDYRRGISAEELARCNNWPPVSVLNDYLVMRATDERHHFQETRGLERRRAAYIRSLLPKKNNKSNSTPEIKQLKIGED